MKVLRGLIQHGQDAIEGPVRSCLRSERPKLAGGTAQTHHGEKKECYTSQTRPLFRKDAGLMQAFGIVTYTKRSADGARMLPENKFHRRSNHG